MTGMNLSSHGTQDLYPTFLERYWHFGTTERSVVTAISMVGALAGGVTIGLLSDRFGRKRSLALSLCTAILLTPLWAYAPKVGWLVTGAFLIQFCVQGAWGVIPAHLSELSPNQIRGFLPGFAYQCGALFAGPVNTFEVIVAGRIGYANAMAATAASVFALTIAMAVLGPEKKGIDFAHEAELKLHAD